MDGITDIETVCWSTSGIIYQYVIVKLTKVYTIYYWNLRKMMKPSLWSQLRRHNNRVVYEFTLVVPAVKK